MWELLIVIIVSGGASPSVFETSLFKTREQCVAAAAKRENATTFGYCTYYKR